MRPISRIVAVLSVLLIASLQCTKPAAATEVRVRYPEGTVHGFLVLRNSADSTLADGDLLQTVNGSTVLSRMVFRFRDGSYFEERVRFTQNGVFRMVNYSLETRGPSFDHDTRITLDRATGRYNVVMKSRDGEMERDEGEIELPADVYNGMVVTIAKNLTKQASTRVHFVAFTPGPRVVEIELAAANSQRVTLGSARKNAVHFVVKPRLGFLLGALAKLLGKMPPDNHIWILTTDVPAFVKAEGPLFNEGPNWRITLAVPRIE